MQFLLILLYIIDNMRNLQNTRNMQICTGKMCELHFNVPNMHSPVTLLMMKRTVPGPACPAGVARGPVLSVLSTVKPGGGPGACADSECDPGSA